MADYFGCDPIRDLVLPHRDVSKRACHGQSSRKGRTDVSHNMVLHDVFLHVLANGGLHNARRSHRNQHISVALFLVSDFLRVSQSYVLRSSGLLLLLIQTRSVLVNPSALPRFWIFMYRVTPLTYFINAMVSIGLSGVEVTCAPDEILKFEPAGGQDCGSYLREYIRTAGGRLLNPNATQQCQFCPISDTDSLLAPLWIKYEDRWRNFGITLVYSGFNVAGALFLYWLARVPKGARRRNP